jgi:hypothetical protein
LVEILIEENRRHWSSSCHAEPLASKEECVHARAMLTAELDQSPNDEAKRSRGRGGGEKSGRGLRHFSMQVEVPSHAHAQVCQKVKEKGTTTYNEVSHHFLQQKLFFLE